MGQDLITGGSGFIGSHMCGLLLVHNHQERVLDSSQRGMGAKGRPAYINSCVEHRPSAVFFNREGIVNRLVRRRRMVSPRALENFELLTGLERAVERLGRALREVTHAILRKWSGHQERPSRGKARHSIKEKRKRACCPLSSCGPSQLMWMLPMWSP